MYLRRSRLNQGDKPDARGPTRKGTATCWQHKPWRRRFRAGSEDRTKQTRSREKQQPHSGGGRKKSRRRRRRGCLSRRDSFWPGLEQGADARGVLVASRNSRGEDDGKQVEARRNWRDGDQGGFKAEMAQRGASATLAMSAPVRDAIPQVLARRCVHGTSTPPRSGRHRRREG